MKMSKSCFLSALALVCLLCRQGSCWVPGTAAKDRLNLPEKSLTGSIGHSMLWSSDGSFTALDIDYDSYRDFNPIAGTLSIGFRERIYDDADYSGVEFKGLVCSWESPCDLEYRMNHYDVRPFLSLGAGMFQNYGSHTAVGHAAAGINLSIPVHHEAPDKKKSGFPGALLLNGDIHYEVLFSDSMCRQALVPTLGLSYFY